MNLQVEFWQLVSLGVTLLFGLLGAFVTVGRAMLAQNQKHIDMRFDSAQAERNHSFESLTRRLDGIEAARREEAAQWLRVERELNALKVDLPTRFVQREDYVRGQSVVEAKLDALAIKLDNVQLSAAAALHLAKENP